MRIDIRRLIKVFVFGLFIPMCIALAIDLYFGFMPYVTIVALLFALPLGTVWVIRATFGRNQYTFSKDRTGTAG